MRRFSLVLIALLSAGIARQARADTAVVEYASSTTETDSRPFTLGYQFSLSTTFDVGDLGVWDDGLANNHEVGIWNSVGTLLASVTVPGTTSPTGHFQYAAIAPLLLNPGTYTIGAQFLGNGNAFPAFASGVTSLAGYTWITDEQIEGAGLNFPNFSTGGGYGANGILYADFEAASVPEPASVVLLLPAAMLVGIVLRRRTRPARP